MEFFALFSKLLKIKKHAVVQMPIFVNSIELKYTVQSKKYEVLKVIAKYPVKPF